MGAAEQREARGATEPKHKLQAKVKFIPHPLGNTDFYQVEEALAALEIAKEMHRQGHAVAWDTQLHNNGTFARSSIIHYLTCPCNRK